jgi:predicted neutral ceramidase superfamily lipid hydrolase
VAAVRRIYFAMMVTCLALFLLAGLVVRHYSPLLALIMAGVALVLPPLAAVVANAGREPGPQAGSGTTPHRPGPAQRRGPGDD